MWRALCRQTFSGTYFWDAFIYLHILFPSSSLLPTLPHSNLPAYCMICDSILLGILYHWHGLNQFWTILSNSICRLQEDRSGTLCWLMCVCVCVCMHACVRVSYICTVSNFIFWVAEINMCITMSSPRHQAGYLWSYRVLLEGKWAIYWGIKWVKPFSISMLSYL